MPSKSKNTKASSRRDFFKKSLAAAGVATAFTEIQSHAAEQDERGVLTEKAKRFMSLFNLKYPIVQAPTAGPAGTSLCIAVANAGAMGALPLSWHSEADAVDAFVKVKNETQGSFFINYVLTFEPKTLDAVLKAGARIVQFSFGMPTEKMVDAIRSAGAKLGVQVTGGQNAMNVMKYAPDYLVCQGLEAGGHVQASRSLSTCLKEVLSVAGDIPVLASGGIATGHDIKRRLDEGASGTVIGTRFVATRESDAHPDYKQAIVNAREGDNVLTACFYKSGFNNGSILQKVLRNDTLEMWEGAGCPPAGQRPGEHDIVATYENGGTLERYADSPPTRLASGSVTSLAMYAGQGIKDIHDIPSAGELVERLWKEFGG